MRIVSTLILKISGFFGRIAGLLFIMKCGGKIEEFVNLLVRRGAKVIDSSVPTYGYKNGDFYIIVASIGKKIMMSVYCPRINRAEYGHLEIEGFSEAEFDKEVKKMVSAIAIYTAPISQSIN